MRIKPSTPPGSLGVTMISGLDPPVNWPIQCSARHVPGDVLVWLHPNALFVFRARKPHTVCKAFRADAVHDGPIALLRLCRQLDNSNQTIQPVSFCWPAALLLDPASLKLAMGCIIPA